MCTDGNGKGTGTGGQGPGVQRLEKGPLCALTNLLSARFSYFQYKVFLTFNTRV